MISAKLPSCAVSTYRVPLSSHVEGRDIEYARTTASHESDQKIATAAWTEEVWFPILTNLR